MFELYKCIDNEPPDVLSYGIIKGKFKASEETIKYYALNDNLNKTYCLVPYKTEFYKLIWDFDFKIEKCKGLEKLKNEYDNIVNYIIEKIIMHIKILIDNPDIRYVYVKKNIGDGVHLYFPNIIVNKSFHSFLFNNIKNTLVKDKKYPFNIIEHVFDACVSNSNGLRFFYFVYNDAYYYPVKNKSTYDFDENNKEEHFKLSFINTNETKYNFTLINNDIFSNTLQKVYIPDDDEDIKINSDDTKSIESNESLIQPQEVMEINNDMFNELTDILNISRINNYNDWINIIYLHKTYNNLENIIRISKKSPKFDYKAQKIINGIFNKQDNNHSKITIGSLIKWCYDDDYYKTIEILAKYEQKVKINNNIFTTIKKPNYFENEQEISKKAYFTILKYIYDCEYNTFFISSCANTGKTSKLKFITYDLIKNLPDIRILYLTQSSYETRKKINYLNIRKQDETTQNIKFTIYSEDPKKQKKLNVTSINNLSKFNNNKYDVIIFDNFLQIFNSLYATSDNFEKRTECLNKLLELIYSAKIIICTDQFINEIHYEFFKFKKIFYYKNNFTNKIKINNLVINNYDATLNYKENINKNVIEFINIIKNNCEESKQMIIICDNHYLLNNIIKNISELNIQDDDYLYIMNTYKEFVEHIEKNDIPVNSCILTHSKLALELLPNLNYENVYVIFDTYKKNNYNMNTFEWIQLLSKPSKEINLISLNESSVINYYVAYSSIKQNEKKNLSEYKNKKLNDYLMKKYDIIKEIIINKYYKSSHMYKLFYDSQACNNRTNFIINYFAN